MKVTTTHNGLVKVDDVVVGEIVEIMGGYCYHHFKFGLRNSSALRTVPELMVRVEEYLATMYR